MSILATYASLLAVSFLAATILPGSSEVFLATIALSRPTEAIPLLAIATTGTTMGATINWALGRWFLRFSDRRWFPVSDRGLALATNWFNRYGSWSLLFSWLPLVGDPLTSEKRPLIEPKWYPGQLALRPVLDDKLNHPRAKELARIHLQPLRNLAKRINRRDYRSPLQVGHDLATDVGNLGEVGLRKSLAAADRLEIRTESFWAEI